MLEIKSSANNVNIKTQDNINIVLDTQINSVYLQDFDVSYPGEYEKGGILLEVKEYEDHLFYHFVIDEKNVVIVNADHFEMKEEIMNFFGDVDILLIVWSKNSAKIFENIEAKVVIPFGEGKDVFLNTLGQHIEEVNVVKIKSELPIDTTEFHNLAVA